MKIVDWQSAISFTILCIYHFHTEHKFIHQWYVKNTSSVVTILSLFVFLPNRVCGTTQSKDYCL